MSDILGNVHESDGVSENWFIGGRGTDERSFILKSQEVASL
jgi:hypothetical protein